MRKLLVAAVSAFIGLSAAAEAAYINLAGRGDINSSGATKVGELTNDAGDIIDLIIAPFLVTEGTPNVFDPTYGLTSYSSGLGINRSHDAHTLDGDGSKEGIVIQAQIDGEVVAVDFTSIKFGYYGPTDDFTIFAGNSLADGLTKVLDDISIYDGNPALLGITATTIAIVADYKDDSFKVKGFSADALPSITDEVPLPGALALFGTALVGFRFARRSQ